jgi:hypothetical protein
MVDFAKQNRERRNCWLVPEKLSRNRPGIFQSEAGWQTLNKVVGSPVGFIRPSI